MFKINIVAVGRIKEDYYKKAFEEYVKRLGRFALIKVYETEETTFSKEKGMEKTALLREEEKILPLIKGHTFALAIEGRGLSSEEFSDKIKKLKEKGVSELTFIVGGSYGLSETVKKRADELISFSEMTFPHTLFRVMLAEQIYRALMIDSGSSYHK